MQLADGSEVEVGAVDANGSVTGVLPGHWAGAPVDET